MLPGNSKRSIKDLMQVKVPRLSDLLQLSKQLLNTLLTSTALSSHQDLIGLVIGSDYIKLLKINTTDNKHFVENFNVTKLPAGAMSKYEILDAPAIATELKNIFTQLNIKSHNVAFTIPRSFAIIKNILVDSRLDPEEIESRVWVEATRLFPNLIRDIYLDFAIVGPSPQEPNQAEVILVACRKEQIKPYLDVVQMAGLTPKIVDINYFALERALSFVNRQAPQFKTMGMLNISFNLIDLLVIDEGKLIYTHELAYDGHQLHELIQEKPNDDDKEFDLKAKEILRANLGLHLKHAMQFFYSSKPSIRIERILLAGDCAALIPKLMNFIQLEVGKEVVLADPFKGMGFDGSIDQSALAQYKPALMLCCGVALSKSYV